MKAVAGLAATLGGGLTLTMLEDASKWGLLSLICAAVLLVGGSLMLGFLPNFLYQPEKSIPRWLKRATAAATALGTAIMLFALKPVSEWTWWQLLGAVLFVLCGTAYVILSEAYKDELE